MRGNELSNFTLYVGQYNGPEENLMPTNRSIAIRVDLTADQVKALADGRALRLVLSPPNTDQPNHPSSDDIVVADNLESLVARWNGSEVVNNAVADGSTKNQPMDVDRLQIKRRPMQLALDEVGYDVIVEEMDAYFEACLSGYNEPDPGRNYAFKSLDGLLSRIRQWKRKGGAGRPWWRRRGAAPRKYSDSDPEHTHIIADLFAERFLGRHRYGKLTNPSRAYECFARAASRVRKLAQELGVGEERVENALMDVVADLPGGGTVYPGHLTTDSVWQIALPQRLQRSG